jgi:hypothetical protein
MLRQLSEIVHTKDLRASTLAASAAASALESAF